MRDGDQVAAGVQVPLGQGGDRAGQQGEELEVALGLPGRVDRRGEGVHEGVHVGARQVVLLVPGGGGEDEVGQQRRRGHPEVGADQQVELALGRLLAEPHHRRLGLRGMLVGHQVGAGAEQVLQEVLVALGRGAEQVRAPHHHRARPVLGGVDVLQRGGERSGLQLGGHPRADRFGLARGDRRLAPRRPGRAGCGRTAGRTASSPVGGSAPSRRRCAARPAVRSTAATSTRSAE